MYNQGDAGEQVFRMALNGTEVVLKITGKATMHLAMLLFSVLKNHNANAPLRKGEHEMKELLKKDEVFMFRIKNTETEKFVETACNYDIPFHIAESKDVNGNALTHVVVPKSWVAITSRIIEDTGLSIVRDEEVGEISGEIRDDVVGELSQEQADDVLSALGLNDDNDFNEPQRTQPTKPIEQIEQEQTESLPIAKEENAQNPFTARTEKSGVLSEPISKKPKNDKAISEKQDNKETKPSVIEKLKQSRNRQQNEQTVKPPKTKNKESR